MTLLYALLLGLIQGLAEFLPISSTGHMDLAREIFRWQVFGGEGAAHANKMFEVALHLGTLLGLAGFFWKDIGRLLAGLWASLRRLRLDAHPYSRLAWLVVVTTLPAAAVGLWFEHYVEQELGKPAAIAALLIIFGLILWLAERWGRKARGVDDLSFRDAVVIGCFQVLSLAPGVSRSGITITGGLLRGMARDAAARYAFLVSLPLLAGATLHGVWELRTQLQAGALPELAVGILAAAVSGFLCVKYFLRYLRRHSLAPFVWYRLLLGAAVIAWLALRAR